MIVTQLHRACSTMIVALLVASGGCAHGAELQPQRLGWTQLAWQDCPADVPGSAQAECALAEVPLDWHADESTTIRVFCRRFRPSGPARGQLWALDGGPGEAGDGFVVTQFRQTVLDAGYELIVPSHRGSAYGTTLACPGAHDEDSCVAELFDTWGSGLAHFDAHASARDVRALVRGHPATDDQRVLMFGGSYGTVWGQRVLQVAADDFDGAYFDSLGDLGMSFEQVGTWTDRVGRELLGGCAATPACDQRFTDGIEAAIARVETEVADDRGCLAQLGVTRDGVQALFMSLLDGVEERALIAPLLQRFDRCDASARADIQAALAPPESAPPDPMTPELMTAAAPRHNPLLNLVVIYRELYRAELDASQIEAIDRQLLFDDGAMAAHHRRRQRFPANFARSVDVATGDYAGDLHLVHGELDPRSPENVIDLVGARWPHTRLHQVRVPEGGHASPRFSLRRDGERCSSRWLTSFLDDPSRAVDAGCLTDVPTIDVAGERPETRSLAQERLGWSQVWATSGG